MFYRQRLAFAVTARSAIEATPANCHGRRELRSHDKRRLVRGGKLGNYRDPPRPHSPVSRSNRKRRRSVPFPAQFPRLMYLRYKTLSSQVASSAAVGAAHLRNGGSIDAGSVLERESGSYGCLARHQSGSAPVIPRLHQAERETVVIAPRPASINGYTAGVEVQRSSSACAEVIRFHILIGLIVKLTERVMEPVCR